MHLPQARLDQMLDRFHQVEARMGAASLAAFDPDRTLGMSVFRTLGGRLLHRGRNVIRPLTIDVIDVV
jgi:hypothetical protein